MKRAVTRWLAYMLSALMMITGIGIMPAASATVYADGEKSGDDSVTAGDTASFGGQEWLVLN